MLGGRESWSEFRKSDEMITMSPGFFPIQLPNFICGPTSGPFPADHPALW
jgi:hypothetical protein